MTGFRCFRRSLPYIITTIGVIPGYFDGSLVNNGEDTDYCYRARLAGFRVVSTPKLIAEHLNGATRRDLDRKEIARSAMKFRRKYTGQSAALPPVYPFG